MSGSHHVATPSAALPVIDDGMVRADEDPVCGMTFDVDDARSKGLVTSFGGREYVFCGKGCFLEFRDDPDRYLDPAHEPQM